MNAVEQATRQALDCSIEGCGRVDRTRRGLCGMHYQRKRINGELTPIRRLTVEERLTAGLERKPNGCLEWTKGTDDDGYGRIQVNGKGVRTHRLAWEIANGPIPDGLHVLHHCDNPPCADVDACLFLGTIAENNADRDAKGRRGHPTNGNEKHTHCPQGHPFDEANTYMAPNGQRVCRKCQKVFAARYRARCVARALAAA